MDSALVLAAQLAQKYLTGRRMPDSAIDLIDEAATAVKIQRETRPEAIDILERKKITLQMEIHALEVGPMHKIVVTHGELRADPFVPMFCSERKTKPLKNVSPPRRKRWRMSKMSSDQSWQSSRRRRVRRRRLGI